MSPTTDDTASLDHQGMEVIGTDECWALVASRPVGRIAMLDRGDPTILPVNHAVVGHTVVFRTARGTLLREAVLGHPIAFEADDFDAAARGGWSVVVRGVADLPADDMVAGTDLESLGLDAWADATARDDWVVIRADEVTGRRIVR